MYRRLTFYGLTILLIVSLSGCNKAPEESAVPLNGETAATTPAIETAVSTAAATTANPTNIPPTAAPTATPKPLAPLTLANPQQTTIETNAAPFINPDGIEIMPPPAQSTDSSLTLSTFPFDSAWEEALSTHYHIDTPLISLNNPEDNDSQGRINLRFPAQTEQSQIVAVIDQIYPIVLNVPVVNGYLETAVRSGPQDGDNSIHYFVISPLTNNTSRYLPAAKPASQSSHTACDILDLETSFITTCRRNNAGTVYLSYLYNVPISIAEADLVIDTVADIMAQYFAAGFPAAKLNRSGNTVTIVIDDSYGSPSYIPRNNTIYLPSDTAKNVTSRDNHDLMHELGHWIQDEAHNMTLSYWSNSEHWWLEASAENMVMLLDPAYIGKNLLTYGQITTSDNLRAIQQSPYQWPIDFYIHAQLIALNTCHDPIICPITPAGFINAINKGSFPFADSSNQAKLSNNLDGYAQYLLGETPKTGNSNILLSPEIKSGFVASSYANIVKTNKSDLTFRQNSNEPHVTLINGQELRINTTVQKDAVLPLLFGSGEGQLPPGLPAMLTIEPGAPFWYKLGDKPAIFHDGNTLLTLGPIHKTMGIPIIRVAAMGKGQTFPVKAKVTPIDLSGAWVVNPVALLENNLICDNYEDISIDGEEIHLFFTFAALSGDFQPDMAGSGLTWSLQSARLPAEANELFSHITFQAVAQPETDIVRMQGKFDWPRATSGNLLNPIPTTPSTTAIPIATLSILSVPALFFLWRKKASATLPTLFLLLLFSLTSCFELDIWGSVSADIKLDTISYVGGETIPTINLDLGANEKPIWELNGTAVYKIDYSAAGNENIANCSGNRTYKVQILIFENLRLNLE